MKCNWLTKTVGELTSYMAKGIPPRYTEQISNTTIYVLNQKCNRNYTISYESSRLHDNALKKVPDEKILKIGDVLINSTGLGTAGRVAQMMEMPYCTTVDGHMIIMRSTDEIDSFYYGYALKSYQMKIESFAEGSTGQTEINKYRLANEIKITYPDNKDLQKYIASIIRSLDDKITINNAINNNLQQQLNFIFQSWFSNDKTRGMTMFPLSDLCSVITKGTTPTTLGKSFTEKGINFIKAESIMDNHSIDKSKFAFIDDETNNILKRSIIQNEDIVFTIAGTLGRFALIDESVLPANTNQAVAIIRADKNKISSYYLYSFFIGNWHNDYYNKRIQQAVQANLSLTTIKSLPIPLLSNEKMILYLELITPLITLMKSNEKENTTFVTIRDALLPKLMSGELDVSKIDI